MAGFVYVAPVDFIRGVCADLAQSRRIRDAVTITHNKIIGGPTPGFNVAMKLEFDSPLVNGGRVRVSGGGDIKPGAVEAEKATVQFLLDAIREKYQFFPSDYNLIVISEKFALFKAMENALAPCHADLREISAASKGCLSATQELCRALSVWIGDNHLCGERADVAAVSAFHAVMEQQAQSLDSMVRHAERRADLAILRTKKPDGLDRLDDLARGVMDTGVCWDRCCYSLQVIYEEAAKKIGGTLDPQFVVRRSNGQYRASIKVTEEPFSFAGESAGTQEGALAKLFYVVIKHVNLKLGFSILDLHHDLRKYQDEYVARFDQNMKAVRQCGELLALEFDETADAFNHSVFELTQTLGSNGSTEAALDLLSEFSADLGNYKRRIEAAWIALQGRQVSRSELEANLAPEA